MRKNPLQGNNLAPSGYATSPIFESTQKWRRGNLVRAILDGAFSGDSYALLGHRGGLFCAIYKHEKDARAGVRALGRAGWVCEWFAVGDGQWGVRMKVLSIMVERRKND